MKRLALIALVGTAALLVLGRLYGVWPLATQVALLLDLGALAWIASSQSR